jgi:ABC-type bacteriocin/lantibiotic exporter with double-glycine peptidase domain
MTIATVIACIQLSNYVVDPVKFLIPLITNRRAAGVLIDKIAEVIEYHEESVEKIRINDISNSIKLSDVTVKYDDSKVALKDVNLEFIKGKSYALVGGSGSGKSTLLKLLMGYFINYQGNAKYDNNDIATIDLDSLYDVVSVVQQSVFLFDKSIKENITMFKEFPDTRVDQAVLVSGLAPLISEKGMDYNCGENGINLSGGEKQRVSIARCLIKETPVLLMDEATASLDNETAFQVESDILDMNMLTRIVVTHRLQEQLLRKYDEIIVLKDGVVEEKGGFAHLMNAKGYFYSLYNVANTSRNKDEMIDAKVGL